MLKATLLTAISLATLVPAANAQATRFDLSGSPQQFMNSGEVLNAQNAVNGQVLQAQSMAAMQQNALNQAMANQAQAAAMGMGGQFASTAVQGDAGRTSNPTGSGLSGVGGLGTSRTRSQSPVLQNVGTMGLAPVFGYGGSGVSPGGYVSGISLFGLGTVRLPSAIGLPGGGAIGLPGLNYSGINNAIGNSLSGF